jgi:hypothetical protein
MKYLIVLIAYARGQCIWLMIIRCASSGEDMKRFGVKTILDLRRMDRPCKKKGRQIDRLRFVLRYARKVGFTLLGIPYTSDQPFFVCAEYTYFLRPTNDVA